jgi:hypothetical protein
MPCAMAFPDRTVVTPRPRPVKATLDDNRRQLKLPGLVLEASRRAFGTQKAAALTVGKDEGNFSRDVKRATSTIELLEGLGPRFLGTLGKVLVEEYGGEAIDPQEQALALIPELVGQFLKAVKR